MFRVLIADDESSVVEALIQSIPWEELGLEIVGTAADGNTALRLVQEKNVDIAILDIRMPGINGLELCERLRQTNEHIQLILASGYAEFAYAEKAIQYGVLCYCLKPIDYAMVIKFLRKAVQNLEKSRHMDSRRDLLEVLELGETEKIREHLRAHGILQEKVYVAVSIGERKLDELEADGLAVRQGHRQWGYIMKSDRVSRLSHQGSSQEALGCYGIGYSRQAKRMDEIYEALDECTAKAYQHFVDTSFVICGQLNEGEAINQIRSIQRKVSNNEWDSVIVSLEEIKRQGRKTFTVQTALRLCNLITTHSLLLDDEQGKYVYSFEQLVNDFGSFEGMLDFLIASLREMETKQAPEPEFSNASFMKLMRYINENYRGDISLNSASQALFLNPNYISQLFKKEAGITFIQYITQRRLDDAKELLVTTKKSLTEIALEVGFNDAFHFSKTFKKIVGMTPGQYRTAN